jgi:hypothetical protein
MPHYTIDLATIDRSSFLVTEHVIGGINCSFVRPKLDGVDWEESNLHLRSSIWETDSGKLVSASYKKFFNLEERPTIDPLVSNVEMPYTVVEKLDGSTLIVSKLNGEYIIRTRGHTQAANMPRSGRDILEFEKTILPLLEKSNDQPTWGFSYIFEWTSPDNKIIIDYGSVPNFYLTNIINHRDYSYFPQYMVGEFAKSYELLRPKTFTFTGMNDLIDSVAVDTSSEGVCLYYNCDRSIRKIKSLWYLKLHAFKAQCNIKTINELYIEWGWPDRKEFEEQILATYDYEIMVYVRPLCDYLYNTILPRVKEIIDNTIIFAGNRDNLSRKEYALLLEEQTKTNSLIYKPLAYQLYTPNCDKSWDPHVDKIRGSLIENKYGM